MNADSLLKIGSIIFFIILWQIISLILKNDLLPSPTIVFNSLFIHITQNDLVNQLLITLRRVFVSFMIAMVFGVAIGIMMGKYRYINSFLDSLLTLALNIPALVTIILLYVWLGLTEYAAILAVVVNKLPTVIVTIREGARSVDNKLLQVGEAFRISPFTRLFKLYFPQLYPYIFAAARNGLSLIWKIVLVVELLGQSNGVGFKLGTFFQFFDITSILAYTIAFASVILLFELVLVQPLERRLNRWR